MRCYKRFTIDRWQQKITFFLFISENNTQCSIFEPQIIASSYNFWKFAILTISNYYIKNIIDNIWIYISDIIVCFCDVEKCCIWAVTFICNRHSYFIRYNWVLPDKDIFFYECHLARPCSASKISLRNYETVIVFVYKTQHVCHCWSASVSAHLSGPAQAGGWRMRPICQSMFISDNNVQGGTIPNNLLSYHPMFYVHWI